MPFLRDEGPPVSRETIEEARRSLPVEYGWKTVTERGRTVILVRVPHPKPDYLHELTEVALYVDLDAVKNAKDVLLVGDEKVCRLEPVLLRDHIRERKTEDAQVAQDLARKLERDYGYTVVDHKFNMSQHSVAVRVPRGTVAEITAEDVQRIREALQPVLRGRIRETQAAYIVSDSDFERVGRRVFLELVDPDLGRQFSPPPNAASVPRPGIVMDKTGSAKPTGVMPSGGLPPPGVPNVPPSTLIRPPLSAPPPLPVDPIARSFVQSALSAPAPAAAPPAAPKPAPARSFVATAATEEYEVFSAKPKAETPAPAAAVAAPVPPAPVAASPAPLAEAPAPGFVQTIHHEEYEVFVSKRVSPDATPVQRAKDEVTDIVAAAARPPAVGPPQDSGGHVVVAVQPPPPPPRAAPPAASSLDVLAERLQEAGYRVVRSLEVEGTTFDLAAHRDGGRRILAKTLAHVDAAQVKSLASVAERLGADACLAVAGTVAPGARLASWGTPVEVLSADEAGEVAL